MIAPKNEAERILLSYIDEHKDTLYETLSSLVRIDTQNERSHGNENAGQEHLAALCADLGLSVERFAPDSVAGLTALPDYMEGRGTDVRENLIAVYEPKVGARRVMLASHMDTVKVGDPSLWEDDPFSGAIKDGKLYGRGAGDDKFGLAVAYFLIKAMIDTGIHPALTLSIGSYVDEEGGGGGGALGLALRYPVDCLVNLDASGFECEALGGGCFDISLRTTKNDKGIASVFDVFTGLNLIKEELEALVLALADLIKLKYSESAPLSFFSNREEALSLASKMATKKLSCIYDSVKEAIDENSKNASISALITNLGAKIKLN
jgi:acetylornithine deacetylase/succinyl-diaminopimelate desuccinylase-like protein